MRAIVNRATQIGLLDKCTSAYWARIRICIFREHNLIPAGIAEKILLRIPATDRCHFGQRGFHSAEQRVQFSLAQRRHLPFRVDPCIEKNILQDAVSQAGNPLLRSKERFGGKIRFSTGHQAVEISGIEPIAERGRFRQGTQVLRIIQCIPESIDPAIHGHREDQETVIVECY